VVGVRSCQAHAAGKSRDSCPAFTEPIIHAWQIPYRLLAEPSESNFASGIQELGATTHAHALLLGE
jgi:hypothetical protein